MKKLLLILLIILFIGCRINNTDPKIEQEATYIDGKYVLTTYVYYKKGEQFVIGNIHYSNYKVIIKDSLEIVKNMEYLKAEEIANQLKNFYEN